MVKFNNAKMCLKAQAGLMLCLCLFSFPALSQTGAKYDQPVSTFHTVAEFQQMTAGSVKMNPKTSESETLIPRALGFPFEPITTIVMQSPFFWVGTKHGLYRVSATGSPTKYFAGKRWLPDDEVLGIGTEQAGRIVWIETLKGFSRIEFKSMTLADKSKAFVERIRARHVRHGFTTDSTLQTPGDLSTSRTVSSDNDGLWTAMCVAAECFRYKVTGDAKAREYARQGFDAILRLESITGIPGFPARSFIKVGEDIQPEDGEWHDTPDKQWRWKGDTSSDEIVGHYFIYQVYYDLVADEAEKRQIRGVVTRLTDHILNHNFQLIDLDGQRTRWGFWGPDAIWEDPDELGLRALHILSHLKVAYHITGNERYQQAYQELINKQRYHLLTRNQKINIPGRVNHSDDELAFLSYYPLLQCETDAKLREVYAQSLERAWQIERPERNPLWNFIYGIGNGGTIGANAKEFDREESLRTLQEIPMDQIAWTVNNSHRLDVPRDMLADRFGKPQALVVLPYDELPVLKWNANPYQLDGGHGGRTEGDGVYFLLPYWMGRYHKLIGE